MLGRPTNHGQLSTILPHFSSNKARGRAPWAHGSCSTLFRMLRIPLFILLDIK